MKWLLLLILASEIFLFSACGSPKSTSTTQSTPASTVTKQPLSVPTYTLNISVSPSGAGSVSPSGGNYESGLHVTLSATPTSGYTFDYWSDAALGSSPKVTVIMDSNRSITAHFKAIETQIAATTTPTSTPSLSEQPLTIELSFLRVNDTRGKYLVQSVFQWKGGNDGFYVESISISYRNDSLEEIFHQNWTADSIKKAWGDSNYISSGATKDWPINVYRNDEINKITMNYTCTIKDSAGHATELSITQSSQVSN
jgi:uncharacterized repeat protein (TIGR02543 family)